MKTRDEQMKEIERLFQVYDRKFADTYLQGIQKIKDSVSLAEIARLVQARDVLGLNSLLNDALIAAGMTAFAKTIQDVFIAGGDYGARIGQANKIEFVLNVGESNTARFLTDYRARLIQQISREMRINASTILIEEVSRGTNPIETARRIKESLGLTEFQERQVQNYKAYLQESDRRALELRLRDARFDPTVARSIKEGRPLTKAQIEKMVGRYRDRYIKRRAETIARTESTTLLNSGEDQYWRQAVAEGVVKESEVRSFWIVTHDSKLRHSHAAIPRMNKEGVKLNESFKSPLGLIRYPSDPNASAANRINCRCALHRRIVKD